MVQVCDLGRSLLEGTKGLSVEDLPFHFPKAIISLVCKFLIASWLLWQLNYTKENYLIVDFQMLRKRYVHSGQQVDEAAVTVFK